jgi:ribosomal protein L32
VISPVTLRWLSVITGSRRQTKARRRARRYVLQLSAIVTRFSECTKQVEITLADPVFDPQRQISRKFFWCPERLISVIGME